MLDQKRLDHLQAPGFVVDHQDFQFLRWSRRLPGVFARSLWWFASRDADDEGRSGWLSMRTRPPMLCTSPPTVLNLRPVPLSEPLVVKNGSNTRRRVSSSMPMPMPMPAAATVSSV